MKTNSQYAPIEWQAFSNALMPQYVHSGFFEFIFAQQKGFNNVRIKMATSSI
jgi:hypothetical protein